jgi:hypothetical protein
MTGFDHASHIRPVLSPILQCAPHSNAEAVLLRTENHEAPKAIYDAMYPGGAGDRVAV